MLSGRGHAEGRRGSGFAAYCLVAGMMEVVVVVELCVV